MTSGVDPKLGNYLREAETWSRDRERLMSTSRRVAWIVACVASTIAIFEAIAIVALTPLKTVVPYTLLVDRQTGFVQTLKPLDANTIAPDAALTRSFIAQYVIARSTFDIDSLKDDYRKVALWSAGEARARYIDGMQATNPSSPLALLPRSARIEVLIRGISSLGSDTALVRFEKVRTDSAGRSQEPQPWSAVVHYRFGTTAMSAADRLINPLGFQVTRYRQNADIPPPVKRAADSEPPTAGSPNLGYQPMGRETLAGQGAR